MQRNRRPFNVKSFYLEAAHFLIFHTSCPLVTPISVLLEVMLSSCVVNEHHSLKHFLPRLDRGFTTLRNATKLSNMMFMDDSGLESCCFLALSLVIAYTMSTGLAY